MKYSTQPTKKTGFKVFQVEYGGGITEVLSIVLFYFFKYLFDMEIPFKSSIEYMRNKEYQGKGCATLFVKAVKET